MVYKNDGSRYVGDFLQNMRHGKGKFFYNDNSYYEGGWKHDKKNGEGKFFWGDTGKTFEGEWSNGER